jgi:hypothetical protein
VHDGYDIGPGEHYAWERREKESDPAWEAFVIYRDMGTRRVQREVCKQVGKHENLISRWAIRHEWKARCLEYDRWLDHMATHDAADALREMRKRHAAIATIALSRAAEKLQSATGDAMTVRDAATLLDLAVKVERLSRGEATESTEISGRDGGPIELENVTPEEANAMLRHYLAKRMEERREEP